MEKSKHVKIYDLEDNIVTEFYTFKEAAEYLGVTYAAAKNASYRGHISQKKYKIRSEGQKFVGFKRGVNFGPEYCKLRKRNNKKRCLITYKDPELDALCTKRAIEITQYVGIKRASRTLSDKYVIKAIFKHVNLSKDLITQELIDVKRKHIELIRKIKNQEL